MYACMKWQADSQVPPDTETFLAEMEEPERASTMMKDYEKNNCGIVKFKKGQTTKFGNWFKQWK